ncbi:alpha/beta fold hydrolase [Prescottella subtropica]|uniref:alpha/beta fold hydrolase n=1 Tax=Prescottella subtropica TaxID=2545757 RepID=UPI00188438BC|nr:alpha/beta hydrolase [Prescottella subtropica]
MYPPGTRYVERDGHALAYQVVGDGGDHAVDVVVFLEIGLHPDLLWTDPHIHYVFERAATFCRMVYFQRRGFGLSDPVDHVPTLEEQADDVWAVMDAVGMRRATLVRIGSTCGALVLIAARNPDRATGLVLHQPFVEGALREGSRPPKPSPASVTPAIGTCGPPTNVRSATPSRTSAGCWSTWPVTAP